MKIGNAAPLGLMGFGMTTVLLSLHNAGLFALGSMILAMGIFYGGIAQIIAGILEFRKGNTFATTLFCSYGLLWLSLVALILLPEAGLGIAPAEKLAMASYLLMWGLFTFVMFFATLKTNRTLQFVFMSAVILFFLLAAGQFNKTIHTIAGYEGIICGFSAIYLALAEVMNEMHQKTVMPIFPVKQ